MNEPGDLRIYSAIACNFSHRTRLALALKGVPAELVEVDLLHRSEEYLAKPSRGSVPALEWSTGFLYGSATVNEFVEEQWPDPPLLPVDLVERATARSWVTYNHERLSRPFETALMNVDETQTESLLRELDAVLADLDDRLRVHRDAHPEQSSSSYWHGSSMGLVDLTYAPIFARFCGLEKFHGWALPDGLDTLAAWIATLLADPVVIETRGPEEDLLHVLERYRAVLRKVAARS